MRFPAFDSHDDLLDAPVADGTSTHLEFTASDGEPQDEELAQAEEDALVSRRVAEAMARLDPLLRSIAEK